MTNLDEIAAQFERAGFTMQADVPNDALRQAIALLEQVEWEGDSHHFVCPFCRAWQQKGHEANCRLAAFFASLRAGKKINGTAVLKGGDHGEEETDSSREVVSVDAQSQDGRTPGDDTPDSSSSA